MSQPSVAVFDDVFPYAGSGFRLVEYGHILRHLPDSVVCSTLAGLSMLGQAHQRGAILSEWRGKNDDLSGRVRSISRPDDLPIADAYYTVFLNNALELLPVARARQIPFAFTLYPGGGLAFSQASLERVREVLAEPLLAKVVVTQPIVREYLISNGLIAPDKIEYIFGVVVGSRDDVPPVQSESGSLSLAFLAHKYHPEGVDKGLDVFVETCERLLGEGHPIRPHIIGPWRPEDLHGVRASYQYALHGVVGYDVLSSLLRSIDIAIFPTRAAVMTDGSFDGFPLGSAVEAGLAGAAVLTTNPLDQITTLESGRDYVSIEPTVESVLEALKPLINAPDKLYQLRVTGQSAMRELYSEEVQLRPRMSMLRALVGLA